jgi:hypothetical protein
MCAVSAPFMNYRVSLSSITPYIISLDLPIMKLEGSIRPIARVTISTLIYPTDRAAALIHSGVAGAAFMALVCVCIAHELHLGIGRMLKLHRRVIVHH